MGLVRTPGYPAFCAAFLKLFGTKQSIVWSQVPIGAGICVLTAWLAYIMFRSRLVLWVSGLLAAFSPTGIGLTAMVLVEVLFTFLMVSGFLCMFYAAARESTRAAIATGVIWAIAGMVKPTLMLWPIAMALIWMCIVRAHRRPARWRDVTICASIQIAVILMWCTRNYMSEGMFTLSAVDARSLRMHVVPMMEEWIAKGGEPDRKAYYLNHEATGRRLNALLKEPNAMARKYVQTQRRGEIRGTLLLIEKKVAVSPLSVPLIRPRTGPAPFDRAQVCAGPCSKSQDLITGCSSILN